MQQKLITFAVPCYNNATENHLLSFHSNDNSKLRHLHPDHIPISLRRK